MNSNEQRFWVKVNRGDDDECWEWQAASVNGYGSFYTPDRHFQAHRFSYKLKVEDPGDEYVLHTCDNPSFVNPEHLYLGDQQDNLNDAVSRGRTASREEHGVSKLTIKEVSHIKWKLENTNLTHAEIAEKYSIGKGNISPISRGVTWDDVKPESPEEYNDG